jgi:hypothetical protein
MQQYVVPKCKNHSLFGPDPIFWSSKVAHLRNLITVFGMMSISTLNCASDACDHHIAALTANVVAALL